MIHPNDRRGQHQLLERPAFCQYHVDEVSTTCATAGGTDLIALREIAWAYLAGAGMSLLGETTRASGLSRVEAGLGNHQLVDEGYAIRLTQGIYALASSKNG